MGELFCNGGWPGLIHRTKLFLKCRGLVPAPSYSITNDAILGRSTNWVESSLNSRCNPDIKEVGRAINVLVFSHNLNREGASISLFELILALRDRGEVIPTLVSFENGPIRSDYEMAGISVVVVPPILDRLSTVRRLQVVICEIATLIQSYNPRLVLANTLLTFPAILAAEQAGIPSIWNPRESEQWNVYFGFLPDSVAQRAIAAIGLPKKVVFVAKATRAVWSDFDVQDNFEVIHNGINLNRFPSRNNAAERTRNRIALGLKAGSIAILCVGTLCARKGQMDLVAAFASLPEAIANRLQILFVGDDRGRYAKALRDRCHSLPPNIGNAIRIFPPTETIASFYAAADLFVLTSKVESFPRVVLEAMAFGLPIITTPVFGVLEQVVEGESAMFYPPGDSASLAKHVEQLVRDESLRVRMSQSSLQRISQMTTFDEMVDAYAMVCRQAIVSEARHSNIKEN